MSKNRRRFSAEFKFRVALEAAKGTKTINELASEYEVHPNQLFKWRRFIHEGALQAVRSEEPLVPLSEVKQLQR